MAVLRPHFCTVAKPGKNYVASKVCSVHGGRKVMNFESVSYGLKFFSIESRAEAEVKSMADAERGSERVSAWCNCGHQKR